MKSLEKRIEVILNRLAFEDGFMVLEVANKCDVSVRTIYSDIKNIENNILNELDIEFINTRGFYSIEAEDRDILIQYLQSKELEKSISNISLKYQIIQFILQNENTSLEEIAKELFYSKSTINNELEQVERMLSKFNIYLEKKPYFGIKLRGSEKDIRFVIQFMINDILTNVYLSLESILKNNINLPKRFVRFLHDFYKFYPDNFSLDMVISLYIIYIRCSKGHKILIDSHILELYRDDIRKKIYVEILDLLKMDIKIDFSRNEVYYLLMSIDPSRTESKYNFDRILQDVKSMLIDRYDNFDDNEFIIDNLILHVKSMIQRNMIGKLAYNPILPMIKEQNPYAFNISADIALMLRDNYSIDIPEEEIGLLSMHIQNLLEAKNSEGDKKYDTLIVSHVGYGNALLLMNQLNNRMKNLNVLSAITYSKMNSYIKENKDIKNCLVITTKEIGHNYKNEIVVKPILDEYDYKNIKKKLDLLDNIYNQYSLIGEYIDSDLLFMEEADSKWQILKKMCNKMCDLGVVKEKFFETVIQRESISSTYAYNGVALPHGYSRYVQKDIIAITILKEPILWDENSVKIIFLSAFKWNINSENRNLIDTLYKLINDQNTLEQIENAKTKAEVIKLFK